MPQAVRYDRFGAAEVLELREVDEVHPTEGRARVRVRTVGLNPYDFKVRSGGVALADPKFPRGIGGDFAGVVDEVAPGATYWDGAPVRVGDEVLGWAPATVRDQLVVKAENLARKPAALAEEVAGALSNSVQTADNALNTLAIGPADTVLLSAAAGSVGFLYAQLALARGASVIGTASASNAAALEHVGVRPTAYGPGLAERVRAIAPGGITAVQDNFGRETILAGLQLGVPASRICTLVDDAAVAELGVVGPRPFTRSAQRLEEFARMAAAGALELPVHAVFELSEVRAAFELLEGRHLCGKVVLRLT